MALELSMFSNRNSHQLVSLGRPHGGQRPAAATFRRRHCRKLGLGTLNFRGESADEEELLPLVCSAERCVFLAFISPEKCTCMFSFI